MEDGLHRLSFGRCGAFQSVNQRQRDFTFSQVAADWLPKDRLRGGEVEDIVHQLKRHSQVPGEITQAGFLFFAGSSDDGSQAGADGEQAGRLAIHQVHVVSFGDGNPADTFELQNFAFHHQLGERNQQVKDAEITFLEGHLKGLHVEPVSGQHAGMVAPQHVG